MLAAVATVGIRMSAYAGTVASPATGAVAAAETSTLFGTAVRSDNFATLNPSVVRTFLDSPSANWDWSTNSDLNRGKAINVSFKLAPGGVIAGTYDAKLRTFFQTAPAAFPVWWTFYHEPEDNIANGEFTAAQYKQAWQHVWTITQESTVKKANIKSALVLGDWTLDPSSGRDWKTYYPGNAYVDVMSWDLYNFGENDTNAGNDQLIADHLVRRPSLAVTQAQGKPYAISELGYNDAATRPAFLTDLAHWAVDNHLVYLTYFDRIGTLGDHRLTDAASIAVWKSAIDGSLFNAALGVTNTKATEITGTSAKLSCAVDPAGGSYNVTVASWENDADGGNFLESKATAVTGTKTVVSVRSNLNPATPYVARCKVYDTAGVLVLKGPTVNFSTSG
jgi:hypothetical protein